MFEVEEKPKLVELAFLVGVEYPGDKPSDTESLLDELRDLVETLQINVGGREVVRIKKPKNKFLLGTGKTEEIINLAKKSGCDCIIFDVELSPGQQRNWERESKICVIDRQEVILDIFAERAQTKDAVLQVELARMEYSLPRLKRAWTHLSRQRGGGVTQRGEGEAQLELDQRMVRTRIAHLKRELTNVVRHRTLQRKRRQKVPVPTAAIVGYTNAGKSSLLNRLTGASVLVEDKLFATLDPTTRYLVLPSGQKLLLTDTVGFVQKLPHHLVDAFKATLEEAVVSDFLIHVIDITSSQKVQHRDTTLSVLKELGADEKKIITVYNKIDLQPSEQDRAIIPKSGPNTCCLSAHTGAGIENLINRMEGLLEDGITPMALIIPHQRYDLVSQLHKCGAVKKEYSREDGVFIQGNIPRQMLKQFKPYSIRAYNGSFTHVNGENIDIEDKSRKL